MRSLSLSPPRGQRWGESAEMEMKTLGGAPAGMRPPIMRSGSTSLLGSLKSSEKEGSVAGECGAGDAIGLFRLCLAPLCGSASKWDDHHPQSRVWQRLQREGGSTSASSSMSGEGRNADDGGRPRRQLGEERHRVSEDESCSAALGGQGETTPPPFSIAYPTVMDWPEFEEEVMRVAMDDEEEEEEERTLNSSFDEQGRRPSLGSPMPPYAIEEQLELLDANPDSFELSLSNTQWGSERRRRRGGSLLHWSSSGSARRRQRRPVDLTESVVATTRAKRFTFPERPGASLGLDSQDSASPHSPWPDSFARERRHTSGQLSSSGGRLTSMRQQILKMSSEGRGMGRPDSEQRHITRMASEGRRRPRRMGVPTLAGDREKSMSSSSSSLNGFLSYLSSSTGRGAQPRNSCCHCHPLNSSLSSATFRGWDSYCDFCLSSGTPPSLPLVESRDLVPEVADPDVVLKLQHLGSGCSSSVYLALHVHTLKLMAVKEVSLHNQGVRNMFRKEITALQSQSTPLLSSKLARRENVACPHIVSYYGCSLVAEKDVALIAVEYAGGGSLEGWTTSGNAAVVEREPWLASVAQQCLEALGFLHSHGRVHKDLKPANILLTRGGDAKLVDFGLSTDEGSQSTEMEGTLRFMAPELLLGEPYSEVSEVWSLGLVLASVALGRVPVAPSSNPFDHLEKVDSLGESIRAEEALSCTMRDFLCACLEVEPKSRATVPELLKHPFIADREDWRIACSSVVYEEIERRRPALQMRPEELVSELGASRSAHQVYSMSSIDRLAFELGTVSCEALVDLMIKAGLFVVDDSRVDKHNDLDAKALQWLSTSFEDSSTCFSSPPLNSSDCLDEGSGTARRGKRLGSRDSSGRSMFSRGSSARSTLSRDASGKSRDSVDWGRRSQHKQASLGDLHELALNMMQTLPLSSHFSFPHWYRNCFSGKDAVAWLKTSSLALSDEEAVKIGNELLDAGAIYHIHSECMFENSRAVYRFGNSVLRLSQELESRRVRNKMGTRSPSISVSVPRSPAGSVDSESSFRSVIMGRIQALGSPSTRKKRPLPLRFRLRRLSCP